MAKSTNSSIKIICENRQAKFHYEVMDRYEAGMMLTGSEVKSLRQGGANIGDAYAMIKDNGVLLIHAHIAPYKGAGLFNHEPLRTRKLLLHKEEIKKLIGKTTEKGLSLIPLKFYFKEGKAKVELGLCKGKKSGDKRETIKRREQDRDMQRAMRR